LEFEVMQETTGLGGEKGLTTWNEMLVFIERATQRHTAMFLVSIFCVIITFDLFILYFMTF
jgi:hypothetical protein